MLHVPPAHSADMAVRSGANAPPIITPPIAKVVAGAGGGGPRPAADLVPPKPGGGNPLISQFVHVGLHVIGGCRQLTAPDAPRKRRPFLDNERVGADVFRLAR